MFGYTYLIAPINPISKSQCIETGLKGLNFFYFHDYHKYIYLNLKIVQCKLPFLYFLK